MAEQRSKDYAAVDVFKMICAILVMLIHTKPFQNVFWLDAGIGMITRFAVPYFFTISGFFMYKKVWGGQICKWKAAGQYLWRLVRFYLIWYVVINLVELALGNAELHSAWYYIKQFIFPTNGSALWFLSALIWGTILVVFLTTWLKTKIVFMISIICLLMGYCFSTLLGVTADWPIVKALQPFTGFIGVQGGLFFAFPYVAMGAVLAGQQLKPNYKHDLLMIITFFICLGAESLVMVLKFNAPLTFLWISALPMTWYVTRLTLTIDLDSKPVYYMIRKISTLFYVLHVIALMVLQKLFSVPRFVLIDKMNLVLTLATFVATTLLSVLVLKLSGSKAFSWMKMAM